MYSESLSFFRALDNSAIFAVSTMSMLCPSDVSSKTGDRRLHQSISSGQPQR